MELSIVSQQTGCELRSRMARSTEARRKYETILNDPTSQWTKFGAGLLTRASVRRGSPDAVEGPTAGLPKLRETCGRVVWLGQETKPQRSQFSLMNSSAGTAIGGSSTVSSG